MSLLNYNERSWEIDVISQINLICSERNLSIKKSYIAVRKYLESMSLKNVQMAILHPPYFDIVKFTDDKKDLSNSVSLSDFLKKLNKHEYIFLFKKAIK